MNLSENGYSHWKCPMLQCKNNKKMKYCNMPEIILAKNQCNICKSVKHPGSSTDLPVQHRNAILHIIKMLKFYLKISNQYFAFKNFKPVFCII